MSDFALWPVLAGAAAFCVVGALWYGVLFAKPWQRAVGLSDADLQSGNMGVIFGLAFAFEVLVAMVLWHLIARTDPAPHVVMMMAVGFAVGVMIPAIGINYLFLRKPLTLFVIDAGHFIVGMAAMGGVFLLFR
jgi:predicted outer membrane lipoprotein